MSCRQGCLVGVEVVTDVKSKLRQDITPAPDVAPLFGPVTSEVMRYLASIAMTAAATVVAFAVDTAGDHPQPVAGICHSSDHRRP